MLRSITEKAFTNDVVKLAKTLGYLVHHSRPAWVRNGRMVTPLQGSSGLPDLIMVRAPRVIFAELKREAVRELEGEQMRWALNLQGCPVEYYVWRPSDMEIVGRILQARVAPFRAEALR